MPQFFPSHWGKAVPFEYLDHTADIGIRGIGKTVEEAFCAAARAVFNLMVDIDQVVPAQRIDVEVTASRLDLLLVEWLGGLISQGDISGIVPSQFAVKIVHQEDLLNLQGTGWGEPLDPKRHRIKLEVKGATYSGLRVSRLPEKWIAQCIVDI